MKKSSTVEPPCNPSSEEAELGDYPEFKASSEFKEQTHILTNSSSWIGKLNIADM